jgi:ribonucleoside-diphosphate reductase alpha chain
MQYNTDWVREGFRSGDNQHNVSVTISVKEDEWEIVRALMWNNKDLYNGISLLPFNGGTYVQAPFEDCTKEKFEELSKLVKHIDLTKVVEYEDKTERVEILACSGGVCEI